ncbi:MAG: hypothetical protein Q7S04_01370 [Candidatus Moranbacteria bacterium]|nr:hypothetical protein [Candidatus Moranbacteria bacterium]
MSLLIPNNSDTGGNVEERWAIMEISKSATQKELVEMYGKHLESLSERTKEIDGKILTAEKRFDDLKKEIDRAGKDNDRISGLVYVGFIALLIVVIGLAFGYVEYIYGGAILDSYRLDLGVKTESNSFSIQKLNNKVEILDSISTCQKYKKYWNYDQCFKE